MSDISDDAPPCIRQLIMHHPVLDMADGDRLVSDISDDAPPCIRQLIMHHPVSDMADDILHGTRHH